MAEPYLGQIQPFPYNFNPRGWAFCQGQLLSIAQNTALFALLGTTFGGNGQTTFGLPDFRGRTMVGVGTGPGLSAIDLGEMSGTESVTLTIANLPAHNHIATATSSLFAETAAGSSANPQGRMLAGIPSGYADPNPAANKQLNAESVTTSVTVSLTGNNVPVPIRDPYLGMNICIALEGIFPSRN